MIKREDDNLETFEKRYQVYLEETKPIIDYYQERPNFYKVNSNVSPEEVFHQIENILGEK